VLVMVGGHFVGSSKSIITRRGADRAEVRAGNERIQSPLHPVSGIYISRTRSEIKIGSLTGCRCEDADLLE